jgi:Restriction endonuclease
MEPMILVIIGGTVFAVGAVYSYFSAMLKKYNARTSELEALNNELERRIALINRQKQDLEELSKQYSEGFPLLADAYADYLALYDGRYASYLETKSHPAQKSADVVRELSKQKTAVVKQAKITEYINKYYETLAPFLIDAKGELLDELESRAVLQEYTQEEQQDPTITFLTKEEYRKLPPVERNQLALDRYWERRKTKGAIGFLYERYVGYLFEKEGYKVEFHGILKGFEDLGRDLIAKKGNEIVVIQCKNWSQFKTIYENHIFQLFGSVYRYKQDYPRHKVRAAFYTATKVSDIARAFSKDLDIELVENLKLERYPCIKCNISGRNREKIYHLPMDQQYDTVIIEPQKGEFYACTVAEAESKGFRRAYRWLGNKEAN